MLFVMDRDGRNIRPIEVSTFSELGFWERKDIERWVEDYPSMLGEELLVLSTEYSEFDKSADRVDIMALDRNGKLVIVELKRDRSSSTADLQAIKYAAFCSNLTLSDIVDIYVTHRSRKGEAMEKEVAESEIRKFIEDQDFEDLDDQPRIILAAGGYGETVTSSVLWLRSFGVDISCVKLEPYKLKLRDGQEVVAVKPSTIIPLPDAKNFMIQREKKEARRTGLTPRQKFHRDFYTDLIERFKMECPGITERKGTGDSWLGLPIGYSNIHFEWTFRSKPKRQFEVGLHFERAEYEDNKRLILEFEKRKSEFEKTLGECLSFEYPWGRRWAKLWVEREDVEDLEALKLWIIHATKKFYEVLKPHLDSLMKKEDQ